MVEVLGLREDLLVGELVDHLGDRLLLVGLLGVGLGGYGHSLALQGRFVFPQDTCAARAGRLPTPMSLLRVQHWGVSHEPAPRTHLLAPLSIAGYAPGALERP